MGYNKKTWADGEVITSEALNNMEEGIANADSKAARNEESIKTQSSKIDNLSIFVTPQMFGAKGDGVTDDSTAIQECFNYASQNGLAVQFNPKTYICYGLNIPAGLHVDGNGATLKKPNLSAEPYNMTVEEMKWARLFSVSYSGDTDSRMTVIENLEFDGNCWEMWSVEDGYAQEQASLLFVSCTQESAGKLFVRIENCYFHDNVSDGIHIVRNTNAIIKNCRSLDCFRGGLTVTGGNTTVEVNGFDSRSEQTPDGIDLEQDSNGYNDSKAVTLSLNNIQIDTDLDISVNSASNVTIDNLTMRKGGYSLRGGGSLTVRNSILIKDIENYTAAEELSNQIYAMTTAKYLFENVVFDGNNCDVAGNDSACQFTFYTPSGMYLTLDKCTFKNAQWGIGGTGTRHEAELHVLNCHFETVNGYGGRTGNPEMGLPFVRLEGNVFNVSGIAIQNINATVTVPQVIKMSNNHIKTCEIALMLNRTTLIMDETWTNGLAVAYANGYKPGTYYGKRKNIVSADPNGTRGIEGANFEDIATDGTSYWKYSGIATVWIPIEMGSTIPEDANLVIFSVDEYGAIFNGTGYKDGYRFKSSSGEEVAQSGSTVSGYIPCQNGDSFEVSGVEWGKTSAIGFYTAVCVYDSDMARYAGISGDGEATAYVARDTSLETEGTYCFTVLTDSAKYIRFSMAGNGADMVVKKLE